MVLFDTALTQTTCPVEYLRFPDPTVIGLVGLAGSGKSTVAAILTEHHRFARERFAGPLKDMLRVLGCSDREIDGDLKEVPCEALGWKTPRHAMQTLGTEWGREYISPHIWVNAWRRRANRHERVVADDCRFQTEVDAVRELGGVIWRIDRPGLVAGNHASEAGIKSLRADLIIENTGTIDDLRHIVECALNQERP